MNFKRLFCLAFSLITVFSLYSCKKNGNSENNQNSPNSIEVSTDIYTTASAAKSESTQEETSEIPVVDETPVGYDYGGHEFLILTAGNVAYDDFYATEESSIVLDNAQYMRKKKVEEDFNIKIVSEVAKARSLGAGPGYSKISTSVLSGDTTYDAAMVGGYDVAVLASENLLYDMNSLAGLDISKSYWDANAIRDLSVNGVMFFTTGDITVADNNALFTLVFNKKIVEDYGLKPPYEHVVDGTWTLETFSEFVKSVSEDLNQDSVFDENDRFGLLVWDDAVMGVINGVGEKCATVTTSGEIELTLYNDRTSSALAKYFDIIYDSNTAICYQRKLKSASGMWNNNQGLFWLTTLGNVPQMREMEADFGIVPYPKLDASQTGYHQTISPYNSQFYCVPLYLENDERTGKVLDALAYYGQKIVTPAYYEKTIVGQSTRDEESVAMLDIILSTVAYDIGYYYQVGTFNNQLIYMVRENDSNFISRYESYKTVAETQLERINRSYKDAVSEWK